MNKEKIILYIYISVLILLSVRQNIKISEFKTEIKREILKQKIKIEVKKQIFFINEIKKDSIFIANSNRKQRDSIRAIFNPPK